MEQAQLLITYLVAALLCVGGKKMGYHLSLTLPPQTPRFKGDR